MPPKTHQAPSDSRRPRRKERHNVAASQVHIKSTFNNTIVLIIDLNGTVIASCSSSQVDFKGLRRSTPYATQLAAESATRATMEYGTKKVSAFVKGPGSGHETAIHSLTASGLGVTSISDVAPRAYNGRRPLKRRHV